MSLPEITVEAGGARHRLAYSIGAMEDVAKINDQFEELKQAFEFGRARWGEVTGILDAGFKAGGADMDGRRYIEACGYAEAVDLAYRALSLFFYRHDPGKNALGLVAQALAARLTPAAAGSESTPT